MNVHQTLAGHIQAAVLCMVQQFVSACQNTKEILRLNLVIYLKIHAIPPHVDQTLSAACLPMVLQNVRVYQEPLKVRTPSEVAWKSAILASPTLVVMEPSVIQIDLRFVSVQNH